MKIGIVRHFKVSYKAKNIMNSKDFEEYITDYDNAAVMENKVDKGEDIWDECYVAP